MRFFIVSLLATSLTANAQNAGINREFGSNGIASLRDSAQSASLDFQGVGACTAPGGGLNVVSETYERTDANILSSTLTVFRLRPDGRTDSSFGNDGTITTTVPPAYAQRALSACLADGRVLVAREAQAVGNDGNIQVLRLTANGALDTSFANNGVATIDMDIVANDLGDFEVVRGINVEADGTILISAGVQLANTEFRAALVRLNATGTLNYARVYPTLPSITPIVATAASLAADGRIWMVGRGKLLDMPIETWYRAELDPGTGSVLDSFIGPKSTHLVGRGRVLANGVMVVAGAYLDGSIYKPRLLTFRESGSSAIDLPAPFPVSSAAAPSINAIGFIAIPIAESRVLYGSSLGAGTTTNLATYAAVVELGATAAADRIDTRFGTNGAIQFAYRTAEPCADGAPTVQQPIGFSNWLGRPVLAGKHAISCDGNSPRNAFVARLLAPDDLTISGFESGSR